MELIDILQNNKIDDLKIQCKTILQTTIKDVLNRNVSVEINDCEIKKNSFVTIEILIDSREVISGTEPATRIISHSNSFNKQGVNLFSFTRNRISFDDNDCEEEYRIPNSENTISCNNCSGNGSYECRNCNRTGKERCSICRGSGQQRCDFCYGRGSNRCENCYGKGYIEDGYGSSRRTIVCPRCGGACNVKCQFCSNGYVNCAQCFQTGQQICSNCYGRITVVCSKCNGYGNNNLFYKVKSKLKQIEIEKYIGDQAMRETNLIIVKAKQEFRNINKSDLISVNISNEGADIIIHELNNFSIDLSKENIVRYRVSEQTQYDYTLNAKIDNTSYQISIDENGDVYVPDTIYNDTVKNNLKKQTLLCSLSIVCLLIWPYSKSYNQWFIFSWAILAASPIIYNLKKNSPDNQKLNQFDYTLTISFFISLAYLLPPYNFENPGFLISAASSIYLLYIGFKLSKSTNKKI